LIKFVDVINDVTSEAKPSSHV